MHDDKKTMKQGGTKDNDNKENKNIKNNDSIDAFFSLTDRT